MGIDFYDDGIKDQFFVKLRGGSVSGENVDEFARVCHELAGRYGGEVLYLYSTHLRMFAVRIDRAGAVALSGDPIVESVEQDRPIVDPEDFDADQEGLDRGRRHRDKGEEDSDESLLVAGIPWGLDRIDQQGLPLSGSYSPPNDGSRVTVYVIDSGINNGSFFGGRLMPGVSFFPKGSTNTTDCANHGTGVAAVIGGQRAGVARGVMLVPVRVWCRGGGSAATITAGVDWVRRNARRPSVANISLSVKRSNRLDEAVRDLVDSGISCVVAAGNRGDDVQKFSPARVGRAITVAASTIRDRIWGGSNFGALVDLFAPGHRIHTFSAAGVLDNRFSGTSLAAGFVSGAAAMILRNNSGATPARVAADLVNRSSQGVIDNPIGSPNRLLRV